jgi:hypothetical protein
MLLPIVSQLAAPLGAAAPPPHPLTGTAAEWMWALPLLPLLGFILNGALSVLGAAHVGPGDPTAAGHGHDDAHPGGDRGATGRPHDPEAGHLESQTTPPRHRFAPAVSIIGPLVIIAAFGLACVIFAAMVSASPTTPFVQRYFSWLPVGDLQARSAVDDPGAGDHGCRRTHSHLQRRVHAG